MEDLLDLIPDGTGKKAAKTFLDFKSKTDRIKAASEATASELKDPKKLKEYFGIADSTSVGSTSVEVDVSKVKTKFKLNIQYVDYKKYIAALKDGNKWLKELNDFDPSSKVKAKHQNIYKRYKPIELGGNDVGPKDPKTEKKAMALAGDLSAYISELRQMEQFFAACDTVYSKQETVYGGYSKMFATAINMFEKVLRTIPFPSNVQAELLMHRDCCMELYKACNDGHKYCKSIASKSKKRKKDVSGHLANANSMGKIVFPYYARAQAAKAKKYLSETKKSLPNFMNKLF